MSQAWKAWKTRTTPAAVELLTMQNWLDESQWLDVRAIRAHQLRNLGALVAHAAAEVPYYRDLFNRIGLQPRVPLTDSGWNSIPVLKRSDVRDLGPELFARSYPPQFGAPGFASSGGSTGVPVRVRKTDLDGLTWESMGLRDEIWHRESVQGVLANLKGTSRDNFIAFEQMPGTVAMNGGLILPNWGRPADSLWETGKLGLLQPDNPPSVQVDFLRKLQPDYLHIRPAGLRLLMANSRERGISMPRLRAVWTVSENVDDSLRDQCLATFGCRIVSNYSAGEAGYIALQCPLGSGYHVMSEVIDVEVLDADGRACAPGEIGRVVVTPLNNYAMPLLRYEIGDEAEVGAPCICGRGLPVLSRILGRLESYLTLPGGERRRVDLPHYRIAKIQEIREFQLAQTGRDQIELRLALSAPLKDADVKFLNGLMAKAWGAHFSHRLVYLDAIPKTASGKLLAVVNELDASQR